MTGEQLRAWRKASGYKHQTDAAKALDVPYRTYQRWERAANLPGHIRLATQALSMRAEWAGLAAALAKVAATVNDH
ncbi:helix-turn-helix transcriptional regulator [Agrobacterium tumefaciens]|uniref:helix-turn-helix transcriptional regulator n=1 Tax=Agrobacterium tumefaciens TaxID=358 RepID=UPI001574E789|nr:helix-turn-helix transcriptional regulator [Agrobacterium tumefaciens]